MKRLFPILLIVLSCVACTHTRQTSSVLDIISDAQYGDTHACSSWANRYWEVFGHRGEMDFMASTSRITPATFDSIRQIIDNEFGSYEYDKDNFPKERITEDGFYWHLSLPSCDDVYYWSNDSLAIAWSLFEVEDNIGYAYLDIKRFSWKWVSDLENKNLLKDSTNYISVYFRFDTIINDFEVSGILYPNYSENSGWSDMENGARLFFYSRKTGKEYIWTDWDESCSCFKNIFMSKNVYNIVHSEGFNGFKSGDTYIFDYDTTTAEYAKNPFFHYAEFQFYDADFDGEDELILGYYGGGPHGCTCYEIYDITDSTLLLKKTIDEDGYFSIDVSTEFDHAQKIITNTIDDGAYAWGSYVYKADEKGNLYRLYYASTVCDFDKNIISSDTTFYR